MAFKNKTHARLAGKIGGYTTHSRYDSREIAARATAGFLKSFPAKVDPEGVLPLEERLRRAEMAKKAHFARLSLAGVRARQRKAGRAR
ncbi:MAG: hypothetical protein WD557_01310 [Dehalococcoidia bacterium]